MLEKKYDHLMVEKDKYNNWKEKGYFKAGDETKKQVKSRGKHFEDKENKRGKHSKKKRKNKANTL